MPPPLKLVVTSEHEEFLWEKKLLNTDTSVGMIQAVIFYLIKCFGLWQGKDLKALKTEHVSFHEDSFGKFVAIDVKMALGSGKVMRRFDDPENPRSVYKILKTYKGYLANEGPFLVRPISSIKDYICYSPWPLGVNIIDQTVVNLMQESGFGSDFGNISVCLMAIDLLKSFGAGSHCISTWLYRLYPRYKKAFWADPFKKCCAINCEDKSKDACLMISHVLDPPYPAETMLFEMKKKQETIKTKIETVKAQRTHVFNSWLSNINSNQNISTTSDVSKENQQLDSKRQLETKIANKSLSAINGHSIKVKTSNVKQAVKRKLSQREQSPDLASMPGCPSDPPDLSLISVKSETTSDGDVCDGKSHDSSVKITSVLSIPESTYSAQIDEAEYSSETNDTSKSCTFSSEVSGVCPEPDSSELNSRNTTRKLRSCLKETPKSKNPKLCIKEEQIDDLMQYTDKQSSILVNTKNIFGNTNHLPSSEPDVKFELENDRDEDSTVELDDEPDVKFELETNHDEESTVELDEEPGVLDNKMDDTVNFFSRNNSCHTSCIGEPSTQNSENSFAKGDKCKKISQVELCKNSKNGLGPKNPDAFSQSHEKSSILEIVSALAPPSSSCSCQGCPSNISSLKQKTVQNESFHSKSLSISQANPSFNTTAQTDCGHCHCQQLTLCNKHQSQMGDIECTGNICDDFNQYHTKLFPKQKCSHGRNGNYIDVCRSRLSNMESLVMPGKHSHTTKLDQNSLDGQLAIDLVHFLETAHKQVQNILKTSKIGFRNLECAKADNRKEGSLQSSKLFSQSSKLPRGKNQIGIVEPLESDSELEIEKEYPLGVLKSGISDSGKCNDRLASCVKSINVAKGRSIESCRCVLDKSQTLLSRTKARTSAYRNVALSSKQNQIKKKIASVRLKYPHISRFQLKLDRSGMNGFGIHRNRNGFHRNSKQLVSSRKVARMCKDLPIVQQLPENETRPQSNSASSQHKSADPHCCSPSLHKHASSQTSHLQKVFKDSQATSAVYQYRSNLSENSVYQKLEIKQENQKAVTYNFPDLPIHLDGLNSQTDSQQGSEICLGDYLPAGAMIPANCVRLLTKQSQGGLELLLKFDFNMADKVNFPVITAVSDIETQERNELCSKLLRFNQK